MRKTVFFRLFSGYALVIGLFFLAAALLIPRAMKDVYIEDHIDHLEDAGHVLIPNILSLLGAGREPDLQNLVYLTGRQTGIRFTVIDPGGKVLADSNKEPSDMENHFYRPEIFPALKGEKRVSIRHSSTLKTEMMYMSLPMEKDGNIIGVLRASMFMKNVNEIFAKLRNRLIGVLLIAILLAGLTAAVLASKVARPISEILDASASVAGGNLQTKISTRHSGPFGRIAESFNTMTETLKRQFEEITERNSELAVILASIGEGLCVIDRSGRILHANPALVRLAGVDKPEGRQYLEVILSSDFAGLFKKAFKTLEGAAGEISIGERRYLSSISLLPGGEKAVASFYDLTERRNTERMKKDFVINVSHELKTPLAAIKGFVETMEDSIEDKNRPYLEVIKRNVDRMSNIVDDLLFLSRLEDSKPEVEKEPFDAGELAGQIMALFKKSAAEKGLELIIEKPDRLPRLVADPFQIESLLINILDNSVKYTDQGRIVLRLGEREGKFLIEVEDTGIGIDSDYIDRVFERFYVVDKSRSRKSGGTGLGLSIVKHIVYAHGGTINIKSSLGQGTIVTVLLPLAG